MGQGGVRQERQLDSLEKTTEMASGYSPCDPTCGGTNLAPRQPQSKTDKDISQDREVAPVRSSSGMARRESFELLGVDWPEPDERMAQGRPPVDGTRERPWRQQGEAQAGRPGCGPAEHRGPGGTPVAQSSLTGRGSVGPGPGGRRGECSSKTFQFYSLGTA